MSGRPVPRGLRGVNPPRDRILCRRRRGRVGHGPTASSPANAFFLVRGSHGRIIYEDLGSRRLRRLGVRVDCLPRVGGGVAAPTLGQGRDAPGERRRNLPLKALTAERPFAVGGGAQRIKESRIERWPKQCPVCPAVGRRAAKLEIERMVGGQGVGGRQRARAVARPWVTRGCATIPARTGLSSM